MADHTPNLQPQLVPQATSQHIMAQMSDHSWSLQQQVNSNAADTGKQQRRVSTNSRPSLPEAKVRRLPKNPSGEGEIQQNRMPKRVKLINNQQEESPYLKVDRRARDFGSESDDPSPFVVSSEIEALNRPIIVEKPGISERPSVVPKSSKNMSKPRQLSGTASSSFGMTPNTNPQLLKPGFQSSAQVTNLRREANLQPIDGPDPAILQSILTPDNMLQFTDQQSLIDASSGSKKQLSSMGLKLKVMNQASLRSQMAGQQPNLKNVYFNSGQQQQADLRKKKLKKATNSSDTKNGASIEGSMNSLPSFPQSTEAAGPLPMATVVQAAQPSNPKKFVSKQKKVVSQIPAHSSMAAVIAGSLGGEQAHPDMFPKRPKTSLDQPHQPHQNYPDQFIHHHVTSAQIQNSQLQPFQDDNSLTKVTQLSSLSPQKLQFMAEPHDLQHPIGENPINQLHLQGQANSDSMGSQQLMFSQDQEAVLQLFSGGGQARQFNGQVGPMLSQQHQRLRVSDLSLVTQQPQLSLGQPEPQIRVSISTTTGAQKSNKNASVKSSKSNKKSLQTSNTNKRRKSISKKKQQPAGNNFSNIIQQHSINRLDALQGTVKPQRKKTKDDKANINMFFQPMAQRNHNLFDGGGSTVFTAQQTAPQIGEGFTNPNLMSAQQTNQMVHFLKSPIYTSQMQNQHNMMSAGPPDSALTQSKAEKTLGSSGGNLSKKQKKKRSSINQDRTERNRILQGQHLGHSSMIVHPMNSSSNPQNYHQQIVIQGEEDPDAESSQSEEEQRLNTVDDYNAASEVGEIGIYPQQVASMTRGKNSSISPNRISPFYLSNQQVNQGNQSSSIVAQDRRMFDSGGFQKNKENLKKRGRGLQQEIEKRSISSQQSQLQQQVLSPSQLLHFQELINSQVRNSQTVNFQDNLWREKMSEGSPSQKSRVSKKSKQSKRSKQSRMSRFSRQSRQKKIHQYQSLASQEERLSYDPDIQEEFKTFERRRSMGKSGHESASSKVQKKLMMQQAGKKHQPQTTASILGGALRLDPNRNPNLDPRDPEPSVINYHVGTSSFPDGGKVVTTHQVYHSASPHVDEPGFQGDSQSGVKPKLDIIIPDDEEKEPTIEVRKSESPSPLEPSQLQQQQLPSGEDTKSSMAKKRQRRSSKASNKLGVVQEGQVFTIPSTKNAMLAKVNQQFVLGNAPKEVINLSNFVEVKRKASVQSHHQPRVVESQRTKPFGKTNSDHVLNSLRNQKPPWKKDNHYMPIESVNLRKAHSKDSGTIRRDAHHQRDSHSAECTDVFRNQGQRALNYNLEPQHSHQIYQQQSSQIVNLKLKTHSEDISKVDLRMSKLQGARNMATGGTTSQQHSGKLHQVRSTEAQKLKADQIFQAYQGPQFQAYGGTAKSKKKRTIKQSHSIQMSQNKRNAPNAYNTLSSRAFDNSSSMGQNSSAPPSEHHLSSFSSGGENHFVGSLDNRNPYLEPADSKISIKLVPGFGSRAKNLKSIQTSVKKRGQSSLEEGIPPANNLQTFSAYQQPDNFSSIKDTTLSNLKKMMVGNKAGNGNPRLLMTSIDGQQKQVKVKGEPMTQAKSFNLLDHQLESANSSIEGLVYNILGGKGTNLTSINNSRFELQTGRPNVYTDIQRNRSLRNPKQTKSHHQNIVTQNSSEFNHSASSINQIDEVFRKPVKVLGKESKVRKRGGLSSGLIYSEQRDREANSLPPAHGINLAPPTKQQSELLIAIQKKQFSLKRVNHALKDDANAQAMAHALKTKLRHKEYLKIKRQSHSQAQNHQLTNAHTVRRALSGAPFDPRASQSSRGNAKSLRTFHGGENKLGEKPSELLKPTMNVNNFVHPQPSRASQRRHENSLPQIEGCEDPRSLNNSLRKKKYRISRAPSNQIQSQPLKQDSSQEMPHGPNFYNKESSASLHDQSEESVILMNQAQTEDHSPEVHSRHSNRNRILRLDSKKYRHQKQRNIPQKNEDYRPRASPDKKTNIQVLRQRAPSDYSDGKRSAVGAPPVSRQPLGSQNLSVSHEESGAEAPSWDIKLQLQEEDYNKLTDNMEKFNKQRALPIHLVDQSQEAFPENINDESLSQSLHYIDHPQNSVIKSTDRSALASEHKIINIDGSQVKQLTTGQTVTSRQMEGSVRFPAQISTQNSNYDRLNSGGLPSVQEQPRMRNNFINQVKSSQNSSRPAGSSSKHTRQMGAFLSQIKPKTQRRTQVTEKRGPSSSLKRKAANLTVKPKVLEQNYASSAHNTNKKYELNIREADHHRQMEAPVESLDAFDPRPLFHPPASDYHSGRQHYDPSTSSVGGFPQPNFATPFNHLCTVEGNNHSDISGQAHSNTITSLCLVPNRGKRATTSTKVFTSSLDSKIKCWNFSTYDLEGCPVEPFQKLEYKYNEIQQNGRAARRIKTNSMVYYPTYDILITGGTDRFINIYENSQTTSSAANRFDSLRYRCVTKITKQGSAIINKMCAIDGDKLIVGQSDEFIKLYSISSLNSDSTIAQSEPLATYKFEMSGINNLCTMNDQNLFISCGVNRNISAWDTRQLKPIMFFKDVHYDAITGLEKLNEQVFASASDDGFINLWDLRKASLYKQLRTDNNERVSSIKFVGGGGGRTHYNSTGSYSSAPQFRSLFIAHSNKVSVLSEADNFSRKTTFRLGGNQYLSSLSETPVSPQLSQGSAYTREEGAPPHSQPATLLDEGDFRINAMEFNEADSSLYCSLSSTGARSVNTVSVWNVNLGML